jgi:hypothetical protein
MSAINPMYTMHTLETIEKQLTSKMDWAFDILKLLQVCRLSMRFLDASQISRLFSRLQAQASKAGYHSSLATSLSYFQLEIFYFFNGSDVH